jgi:hypothetical protein
MSSVLTPDTGLVAQLGENKRKVDFDTFDISVKELVGMVRDGLIDIAPEYQRQFRWTDEAQSTFIESVFLGIPIPSLFTAANPDGRWELIDGVQRLSSLIRFIGDDQARAIIGKAPLRLVELAKLSLFNGKTFLELPSSVQLQFSLRPLKVTTISDKSDHSVRFDLFERLNTGGVKLEPQEIRRCIFQGPFNELLRRLAQYPAFRKVVKLQKSKEHDATREELVLRFFAFYHNYKSFDHSVIDFLNDYMDAASQQSDFADDERLFKEVFDKLQIALPSGIVRGTRNITPVNLYESISVGAALALQQKGELVTDDLRKWMNSYELSSLTTGATNSKKMVADRIRYSRDKFLGK